MSSPSWVPPLIRRLAVCETHGNPRHQSGSYGGIVGWYVGTWQLDRYAGMPRHRYYGCLHGPEHAWVRG